jgi:D-beta-D-heptose 7-phosphate kinase/D-beta-D-heptose 1-phosphate adenosyltransferase
MRKIVIVGDVIWDQYVFRTTGGGSRANVEIVSQLGGSGNVFRSVANLYEPAYLISVVGQDSSGQEAARALQHYPNAILLSEPGRTTPTKIWNFENGVFHRRDSIDCNAPILAVSEQEIMSSMRAAVGDGDIIVISDYCKGVMSDALILAVLNLAKAREASVVVDSKRSNYSIFQDVYFIKQNRLEAQKIVNEVLVTVEDLKRASHKLQAMTEGMCLLVDREQFLLLDPWSPASPSEIVGAGDIVLAISALSMVLGQPLQKSLRLAGALIAAKAGHHGTVFVEFEDLRLLADATHSSGSLIASQFYKSLKGYPLEYVSQRL